VVSKFQSDWRLIRVAFTLIDGRNWMGGYNYQLNLMRAIADYAPNRIQPILFVGTDMDESDINPFELIKCVVVRDGVFNQVNKARRLRQALLTGRDQDALAIFSLHTIDIVFESAQFYGWRFPLQVLAWIPDFQHRHLKHLFDFKAYWKREIGFRVQMLSGRNVMLSSADAKNDCETFYPNSINRTYVVRFSVPPSININLDAARKVADRYGLPVTFFFLPNQFWKHKNHECVIHALASLKARGVNLVVAASGKQADPRDSLYFPMIQQLIKSCNLEHNFRFLGMIPHEHIPALMKSCAALINPSRFEGWSTTVEEAKAIGTPMILSSLNVHREQSEDALFFDPASPEQLAVVLENFIPLSNKERIAKEKYFNDRAFKNMTIFADEFSSLIELQMKCKRE
jgi:glycosyltransferase involved in cell wall biosynthesis